VLGSAESAPNLSHRPDARKEARLNSLSFNLSSFYAIAVLELAREIARGSP